MVSNCNAFYKVQRGEDCQTIINKFANFTLDDFVRWNSGVGGRDCRSLWADTYACVGVSKSAPAAQKPSPTSTAVPTHATVSVACNAEHPVPTQPGSICGCTKWHLPEDSEFCYDIEARFGLSAADFNKWNPSVGSDCRNLWKGYFVCVGV